MNYSKKFILATYFSFAPIFLFSQTLTVQSSGTTVDLTGVHFFSPDDGVACGQNVILTTNNGGQSWTFNQQFASWADVFMTSANIFYTVAKNGTVYKTINGGTNFTLLTTNTTNNLGSVFFITPQIGWISGQGGTILKTTNAGQTWTPQVSNTQSFLYQIYFINQNIGWAVGAAEVVLTTNDGGNTWTPQTATVNGFYRYKDIYFINSNEGWLIGNNGARNGLFKTTNGGTNWNQITTVVNVPQEEVQFLNSTTGFSCFFTNSNLSTTIRKTTDGGNSWTSIPVPGPNENLVSIHFPSPNVGFAVGENGQIVKISTTTGIDNTKSTISLNLFPNPISSNQLLTIDTKEKINELIFYDLLGKQVLSIKQPITNQVSVNNLTNGMYTIKTITENGIGIKKLLIN